jgi:hypothetical protein
LTLLGRQLCGSELWTRKQRDAQEIEDIQGRILRPGLEPKILDHLTIPNIPKSENKKIFDNLK